MNCPTCNGEMWDNSEKVATGWRGPKYKCKDKNCGGVIWPPKTTAHDPTTGEVKTRAAGPGKPKAAPSPGAKAELIAAWKDCFDQVYEHTNGKVEDGAMMAGVNSLFIAVSRLITNG